MASLVTSERREQILKERIKLRMDALSAQLKNLGHNGLPMAGHKADGPTKLRNYQRDTLPEEMAMILDPDYIVKMTMGLYPEPVPVLWYGLMNGKRQAGPYRDPNIAAQECAMMGFPPNPDGTAPIESHHSFWSLLLELPTKSDVFVAFDFHAREYKRLIDELGQKIEEAGNGSIR